MRIIVRTAGGSRCEVLPSSSWTCHDLHMDIERKLGIPAAEQRLLLDSKLLETMGQLLQMSARHEGKLELLLYIRSTAVIRALEAVKKNGRALLHASEELKGDREFVMVAVKHDGHALQRAAEELQG
mmetsp:Transcript_20729/g.45870  ORF Transcript_20729/g.45870 Transcript_20729/m.45870 type:complete len:127 (-) Transcript_20729:544-924(-)